MNHCDVDYDWVYVTTNKGLRFSVAFKRVDEYSLLYDEVSHCAILTIYLIIHHVRQQESDLRFEVFPSQTTLFEHSDYLDRQWHLDVCETDAERNNLSYNFFQLRFSCPKNRFEKSREELFHGGTFRLALQYGGSEVIKMLYEIRWSLIDKKYHFVGGSRA